MKGTLYIVSTPIGNLKDITLRALEVLKKVDVIVCEDTRVTLKLLNYYGISKPLISFYKPKESEKAKIVLKLLIDGKDVALTSDSGTPLVSDPGYVLVELAVREGIRVVPIPGPSSVVSALVASGIVPVPFSFWGFLPRKNRLKEFLENLKEREETLVFFESPSRILDSLVILREVLGNRKVCIAREITKVNEEFIRGSVDEVIAILRDRGEVKGEIVVIVEGKRDDGGSGKVREVVNWKRIARFLVEKGLTYKEMEPLFKEEFGVSRRELYNYLLSLKGRDE